MQLARARGQSPLGPSAIQKTASAIRWLHTQLPQSTVHRPGAEELLCVQI